MMPLITFWIYLKNYGKKRNIFEEIPFRLGPLWKIDKEEYYNKMLKYTGEVI